MNYQTSLKKEYCLISGGILSVSLLGNCTLARAQITADDSVSTEVDRSNNVSEIVGGTTKGSNLFHSFQEFSVPQNNTAWFNNSDGIGNIISRVTGGTVSNINGLIRANGNANLILINPNGINFGANARLDIGGSFLGSTASSLIFDDGTIFSAKNTDVSPLLTVSVPMGLQLGQNSAAIDVRGTGHDLSLETTVFSHFTRGNSSGLEVDPGKALTLVGNGLSFAGGILLGESGEIKLGSVTEGTVGLNLTDAGWTLDYDNVSLFGDIDFSQKALIDVSGNGNGLVELDGREILLQDGSAVLSQNFGSQAGGDIKVNATESLTIVGAEPTGEIASGLYSETLGNIKGADIEIETPQLIIEDGASIISTTSGDAPGGNVNIQASELLQFVGFSQINPNLFSVVSVQTFGPGNAGNISVSTKKFTALDGANISSVTGSPQGTGSGGNVKVRASESIELIGANPITFAPSQITAGSGSPGSAGNVEIDTARLSVRDGARVDASATASGSAGNVTVDATESIEVGGTFPGSINPSLITASANILDPALRSLFGLPDLPSGDSGGITITTPRLQVGDRGQVTVRNDGTGNAGNLSVAANEIELNNAGGITAAVKQGIGGKITLDVAESLSLTNGGVIISDNFGAKDGGEISISAKSLNISDRAFITTTSFGSGNGGDITLKIADSVEIEGTGYEQFQQAFQLSALDGSLKPSTRGTGIFIGTAAGGRSGNLQLNTSSLNLREGAIISSPIFTTGTGGDLKIEASNFEVVGSAVQITAGVNSTNAAAGNITIDTNRLSLRDGGTIVNATFGDAAGGKIDIDATEEIAIVNTPDDSLIFAGIYASTSIGTGDSGGIDLTTDNLYIDDGLISSNSGAFIRDGSLGFSGGGDGGNISIEAAEKIEISGIPFIPGFASGISSGTYFQGTAGNIDISTDKLSIRDGSEIAAITAGSGDGGNLTIDAESIDLVGITTINNMARGGLLAASGRGGFGQQQASGSSGDIEITTENLTVQNFASVDVQSLGTGNAGNLKIVAEDSILLNDRGTISAAANSGNGGNINLIADNIFWRGGSTTTATASNDANGGNIDLRANYLVALEASRLTADADAGRGGNIDVDTEGLFVCEECRVSASSRLGIDGIISITTLEPNPNLEVVDIPIQLTQPEEAVALACSATQEDNASKLIVSGRGGLPPRPSETLNSSSLVSFGASARAETESENEATLPAPARNWYVNEHGTTILTAQSTVGTPKFNSPNCNVP